MQLTSARYDWYAEYECILEAPMFVLYIAGDHRAAL